MTQESNTPPAAPEPRSVWRHREGALYTVERLTNEHSTQPDRFPVTVVYRGEDGKVWSRPLADWHRSMTALSDEEVGKREPTLDGEPVSAVLAQRMRTAEKHRADMKASSRHVAVLGGLLTVVLIIGMAAVLMLRIESEKTHKAVADLRAVEQTLTGLTDVQAQEIVKRKMLREIQSRAAKAGLADAEAGKHVD